MIKTWEERCVEHPDHQTGMVTHAMIQMRMQEEIDDLRAAVFDPDWDRVKALEESLREHMAEIQRLKAIAQPEQLVVGGDDLPTLTKWTPMSEYAAKSAAVPGRAEALKQAGYTRRLRQLPKEDEPVAWQERQEIQPGKFGAWYLIDGKPPAKSAMPVGVTYEWQPLYAHPPQRKPLTEEEIYKLFGWYAVPFVRAVERAHGIGGEP